MAKYVYQFGGDVTEGSAHQRDLLGGKGANLAEMAALGIPVPPGFTLTTEVCGYACDNDGSYPEGVDEAVRAALSAVGERTGTRFGDSDNALLLSVRSGAPVSMPGMMDSILNLGLNDDTVSGLARQSGNERFAYDCYRRFVAMYGEVVMGVKSPSERDESPFERLLVDRRVAANVDRDIDLSAENLKSLVTDYKIEILRATGKPFPEDPFQQLWGGHRRGVHVVG